MNSTAYILLKNGIVKLPYGVEMCMVHDLDYRKFEFFITRDGVGRNIGLTYKGESFPPENSTLYRMAFEALRLYLNHYKKGILGKIFFWKTRQEKHEILMALSSQFNQSMPEV